MFPHAFDDVLSFSERKTGQAAARQTVLRTGRHSVQSRMRTPDGDRQRLSLLRAAVRNGGKRSIYVGEQHGRRIL